jgi:hypothetical protein
VTVNFGGGFRSPRGRCIDSVLVAVFASIFRFRSIQLVVVVFPFSLAMMLLLSLPLVVVLSMVIVSFRDVLSVLWLFQCFVSFVSVLY